MAFGDLCTLAQCQAWIVPTPKPADNALLSDILIPGASDFITHYLNRFIPLADYEEIRDGQGGPTMVFANYPVLSVASLTIGTRVIPPSLNRISFGYVFNRTSITLRGGERFWRESQNVIIDYTAGHQTIPPAITEACIELVAVAYKERSRLGVVSENVQGLQSDTYRIMDLLPRTKMALDLFKNVTPISADSRRRAPTQTDPALLVGAL